LSRVVALAVGAIGIAAAAAGCAPAVVDTPSPGSAVCGTLVADVCDRAARLARDAVAPEAPLVLIADGFCAPSDQECMISHPAIVAIKTQGSTEPTILLVAAPDISDDVTFYHGRLPDHFRALLETHGLQP
jgi:hypothetical protein